MPAHEAWGLDIGQTAIRAVKLSHQKDGSVQISDAFFKKLDTQIDDENYDAKVTDALAEFVSDKNVQKKTTNVGIV